MVPYPSGGQTFRWRLLAVQLRLVARWKMQLVVWWIWYLCERLAWYW